MSASKTHFRKQTSAFSAYSDLGGSAIDLLPTPTNGKKRKRRDSAAAAAVISSGNAETSTIVISDHEEEDDDHASPNRQVAAAKSPPAVLNGNGQATLSSKKKKQKKKRKSSKMIDSRSSSADVGGNQQICSPPPSSTNGVWRKVLNSLTFEDSGKDARLAFAWLIDPIPVTTFFETYWEKKPLHIRRACADYFRGLFSSEEMDKILREHDIQYTVNLDITKYEMGERKTLNPNGRAYPATVWKYYKEGCSIRLLNPQTYSDAVWKLNSTMQEMFGTFVGANVYLTPEDTQGFAPHYDDIEAFVVQLEGSKRWRVYKPRNDEQVLPRFSSPNFKSDEIGKPVLEVDLNPGDLLYFPRGFIHQAVASKEEHSLHVTISATQANTWGDFLRLALDQALETAMIENAEYRRSLPLDYMDLIGTVHMDKKKKGRKAFLDKAKDLLTGLADYASIDGAADQMAKKYLQDSLPPSLSGKEVSGSIHGDSAATVGGRAFTDEMKVRLIRRHCLRLVMEEEKDVSVYYNTENSRTYHEKDLQRITLDVEMAPGVDYLVETYPKYVAVKELPLDSRKDKVRLCELLYEKALLTIEDKK